MIENAEAHNGELELSVVVPCFNEAECIIACYQRLTKVCRQNGIDSYELIFVNDGSMDESLSILRELCNNDEHLIIVDLSRNHGHQLAISAGLSMVRGRLVLVIDADLQDPPELLGLMLEKMNEGADIVYGKRRTRAGENWFKLGSAKLFYRMLNSITNVQIPPDVGDFRLMRRQIVDILNSMPEAHRFIRGLVAWIGYRQVAVEYDREPRQGGVTKYPFTKMLPLAIDGATGFSSAPLRIVFAFALAASILAIALIIWSLYNYIYRQTVPGWSSLMVIYLFFTAIQMFSIGVLGEYVGRTFIQSKGRPLFLIQNVYGGSREGGKSDGRKPVRTRGKRAIQARVARDSGN